MMLYSHGRVKATHRQSVLDLDITYMNDSAMVSPNSSLGSGQSTSSNSSKNSPYHSQSYNSKILDNIRRNGLRINPDDIYKVRREAQDDYNKAKTVDDKKKCLKQAIETLDILRDQMAKDIELDTSEPFFIFEYQALVCWIYSVIRFSNFMSELDRHFQNMKEEHFLILRALPANTEDHLMAVIRFSNMCIEYAPICDEEAVEWCTIALERCSIREIVSNNLRNKWCNRPSAVSHDLLKKEQNRLLTLVNDLQNNLQQLREQPRKAVREKLIS